MSKKANAKESQLERFVETARGLGCDEDKERFEGALSAVAKSRVRTPEERRPERSPPIVQAKKRRKSKTSP